MPSTGGTTSTLAPRLSDLVQVAFFLLSHLAHVFSVLIGHIFNNVFDDNNDGINTRDGAELLVENNVWTGERFIDCISWSTEAEEVI